MAEHRRLFSVRAMCRCLRIHPSGFYAWLKSPLSKRAQEDGRQTELIRRAWKDSGKVYGYRKIHDDLLDQGETCCPNRVARLARMASIKAQIGYKRRPGSYGGTPSVIVDNTLDRQFDVEAPDKGLGHRHHLHQDPRRLRLSGCRDRLVLSPCRWLVHAEPSDNRCCAAGTAHGGVAQKAEEQGAHPFGPGFAIHQHGLGIIPAAPQSGTLHEPPRELP